MSLEEKLAELKAYYGTTLVGKSEKLSDTLAGLKSKFDLETLTQALRQAHTLKGTAGSYGFVEFGDCAERVETLLRGCQCKSEISDANWKELETALLELKKRAQLDGS